MKNSTVQDSGHQNPLIGDFGTAMLSLNSSWAHLKKLVFCGCYIDSRGSKFLMRNKQLKYFSLRTKKHRIEKIKLDKSKTTKQARFSRI